MTHTEPWLWRWWRGEVGLAGNLAGLISWPAAALYGFVTSVRNRRYDAGSGVVGAGVPVLSVGNLTVGGTGKTPIAGWVMATLAARGWHPGLLLRGYGTDEVRLHERWVGDGIVVAEPDRVLGARRAIDEGADVLVLDDGFQHRRLARDIDLVLLSAEQHPAVQRGHQLPRGPLREAPKGLRRAHAIIVTHRTADPAPVVSWVLTQVPTAEVLTASLRPAGWLDIEGRPADPPHGPVVALSSVANPGGFWAMLEECGLQVEDAKAYGDHHEYRSRDLKEIDGWARGRPIVTTEKDAVKLSGLNNAWVLCLEVDFGADLPRAERLLDGLGT